MRNTERLYDRVIEKMDMTCDMEDEELQELIHEVLEEASKEEFIPLQEKIRISKELFNAFRKLDILQQLRTYAGESQKEMIDQILFAFHALEILQMPQEPADPLG